MVELQVLFDEPMDVSFALALGFVLGVRHATDADHILVIGALLRRRPSLRSALVAGGIWSVGHSLMIGLVGVAMIFYGVLVSDRVGRGFELAVAAMLIVLGAGSLRTAAPVHSRRAVDAGNPALRSLVTGMIHGLAGSAGITLLSLATLHSRGVAALYLGLFGLGTVAGMIAITALLSLPLGYAAQRSARVYERVVMATSVVSIGFGVVLGTRILLTP